MIEHALEGGLCTLTINRPDKANSLTAVMLTELRDHIRHAAGQGACALILTGRGKVFSAGADLDEARAGLAHSPLWDELSGAVADFPGLTIAALNGTLAGGAMGMALACDLRLAVAEAKFFYPVMKLGFLPQPADPARLTALVGPARAKMILMAGARIDAATALAWGLIDQIWPEDSLIAQTQALVAPVLAAKTGHPAAIKRMIPPAGLAL